VDEELLKEFRLSQELDLASGGHEKAAIASVIKGLIASRKGIQGAVTQMHVENLIDGESVEPRAESRKPQAMQDPDEVDRPSYISLPGSNFSATENSNSTPTSSTIRQQTPHRGNQNQIVEPRVRPEFSSFFSC
jgi:DNA-binding transcriptional MocR family regulator